MPYPKMRLYSSKLFGDADGYRRAKPKPGGRQRRSRGEWGRWRPPGGTSPAFLWLPTAGGVRGGLRGGKSPTETSAASRETLGATQNWAVFWRLEQSLWKGDRGQEPCHQLDTHTKEKGIWYSLKKIKRLELRVPPLEAITAFAGRRYWRRQQCCGLGFGGLEGEGCLLGYFRHGFKVSRPAPLFPQGLLSEGFLVPPK